MTTRVGLPWWLPGGVALGALHPSASLAAPWYVQPTLGASAQYQSNPQFSTTDAQYGAREALDLSVPARWSDGYDRFDVQPRASVGTSSGNGSLGTDSDSLDLAWGRTGERNSWRANADYSRIGLLAASPGYLGILRPSGYLTTRQLAAGATLGVTERDTVDVSLNWTGTRFSQSSEAATPFNYRSASAQYFRALSPRLQWLVSGSSGDFTVPDTAFSSRQTSVLTGLRYVVNAATRVEASIGQARASGPSSRGPQTGAVYSLKLDYHGERRALQAHAVQSIQPSGTGQLTRQRDVGFTASWSVTARFSSSLDVASLDYDGSFLGFQLDRHAQTSGGILLRYLLTPDWQLSGGVAYTRAANYLSLFNPNSTSVGSVGATLAMVRSFGAVAIR